MPSYEMICTVCKEGIHLEEVVPGPTDGFICSDCLAKADKVKEGVINAMHHMFGDDQHDLGVTDVDRIGSTLMVTLKDGEYLVVVGILNK